LLEREAFASGRDRAWITERRHALATATATLDERVRQIVADPDVALRRSHT
jgi:hypothetical protein